MVDAAIIAKSGELFRGSLNFTRNYKPVLGDIVLSRVGSYGVSSYVATDEQFCLGQNTVVINSKINSKYLYYILNGPSVELQIEDGSYGSGYKSLSLKNINDLFIAVPSDIEQSAIARALSDTDALLSELEKLIAKKQAIKTAAMQQLLTGRTRLPLFAHYPDGSKKGYKQSELGEIPEDWELIELGELLSYEQPTRYLVDSSEYFENGTVPVLTAGKTFILGYTAELDNLYTKLPVIIFDDFTTASKYVDFPFKAKSSAMKMLRPKNEYLPLALIYSALNSIEFKVGDHKRHWISEFSKLKIKWPRSNEEQTAIATILSDMDAEIQALEQRLNKTRQIKQGMMQELLTGKVRLV